MTRRHRSLGQGHWKNIVKPDAHNKTSWIFSHASLQKCGGNSFCRRPVLVSCYKITSTKDKVNFCFVVLFYKPLTRRNVLFARFTTVQLCSHLFKVRCLVTFSLQLCFVNCFLFPILMQLSLLLLLLSSQVRAEKPCQPFNKDDVLFNTTTE